MRPNRLTERLECGQTAVCGWVSIDSPTWPRRCPTRAITPSTSTCSTACSGWTAPSPCCRPSAPARPSRWPAARRMTRRPSASCWTPAPTASSAPPSTRASRPPHSSAACRYPPTGTGAYGPSRGLLYGGPDYVEHADDTILTWAMIESRTRAGQPRRHPGHPGSGRRVRRAERPGAVAGRARAEAGATRLRRSSAGARAAGRRSPGSSAPTTWPYAGRARVRPGDARQRCRPPEAGR